MLPVSTWTDLFEALKNLKGDAKASEVDSFLTTLPTEHDAAGARAQLRTLWIGHIRAVLQDDEEAPVESGAGEGQGGVVRVRARTPPDSPWGPDTGGAA